MRWIDYSEDGESAVEFRDEPHASRRSQQLPDCDQFFYDPDHQVFEVFKSLRLFVQPICLLLLYTKNLRLVAYHCFHDVFKTAYTQLLRFHTSPLMGRPMVEALADFGVFNVKITITQGNC